MRRLNVLFLGILLTVIVVLGGGMHLVHGIQIRRNASVLLDRARKAETGKDLETAEQSLSQYLNFKHEDGNAWKEYARVLDEKNTDPQRRDQVFLVHEQALRYNPEDSTLERRCADLALEQARYNDARRHLANLLEKVPNESKDKPVAAELEDLLGQCERGLSHFADAEKLFEQAIRHDPRRVDCYDRLARLLRADLRRLEPADGTITRMVAANPQVGRAYIYRWRYSDEFLPPADARDLQKALKLAPDDVEVLVTAAIASEQKRDFVSARHLLREGIQAGSPEPRLRPRPRSPGDPGRTPRSSRGCLAAGLPGRSFKRAGFLPCGEPDLSRQT